MSNDETMEALLEDEAARLDETHRASRAEQLLKDDLLAAAFTEIREEFLKAWSESPARDVEGREQIFTMLKLLDRVKATLENHVTTGQMAMTQLEMIQARIKKFRDAAKRKLRSA